MKLRERRDAAQCVQVQIVVEVPVNVIQHPLHPGMVILKRRLHRRRSLHGDTRYTRGGVARSTDLAVWRRLPALSDAVHRTITIDQMTIRPIVRYPDPRLALAAEPVTDFNDA